VLSWPDAAQVLRCKTDSSLKQKGAGEIVTEMISTSESVDQLDSSTAVSACIWPIAWFDVTA
jgi:hypothetical protein